MTYEPQTFIIPEVNGISTATMDNHLKLYAGYVKHVNLIAEKISAYSNEPENNGYAIAEMQRRLGFEFGGMRNHEYYFAQLEGGATTLPDGTFKTLLEKQYGNIENFFSVFRTVASTRGVGWAMLYYDRQTNQLVHTWVDEQHLGQLADLDIVLAIDMWEHSYMHDYLSADKGKYLDAYLAAINWETVAARIDN